MRQLYFLIIVAAFLTSCTSDVLDMPPPYESSEEFTMDYIDGNVVDGINFSNADTLHCGIWTQLPDNGAGTGISSGGCKGWEITTAVSGDYKLIHIHRDWVSGETRDTYIAGNLRSELVLRTTPECTVRNTEEQIFLVYSDAFAATYSSTGIDNGEYTALGSLGCVNSQPIFFGSNPQNNEVPVEQREPNILLSQELANGKVKTLAFHIPN